MVETADAETDAEALPIEAPQTSLKWVSWEEVGHLYNAISLIGILAKPVELKSVRDMVVANTLLSVRSGTRDAPTTLWCIHSPFWIVNAGVKHPSESGEIAAVLLSLNLGGENVCLRINLPGF